MHARLASVVAVSSLLLSLAVASADEGMWLPNKAPLAALKQKYNFEPTPQWMEHLQKSAVRFNTGGSGSIVSKEGLVMTNHHVGSETLASLSTAQSNLLANGFSAKTHADELKCPGLEIDVLWTIEDVTDKVEGTTKPTMSAAEAGAARRAAIASLEADSQKSTGMKSEVVTLYQGARYHLYRYKTYRDVRLVFAPEQDIAFFGGDTDNFEFPRFDLDCCFFRLYENDKPLNAEHHLAWSKNGAAKDEVVFVWGHPARTQRLFTEDHLKYLRDVELVNKLSRLWRSEVKLQGFMARNQENARVGRDEYLGVQNSRKAYQGLLDGLQDPKLMARKKQSDDALRTKLAKKSEELKKLDSGNATVASSLVAARANINAYDLLETGWRASDLVKKARQIVRLIAENAKPNGERLHDYVDSNRETLLTELYAPAPVHDTLEVEVIASQIARIAEHFGGNDPLVAKLLAGKSPRERAGELVSGCTLRDPATRKKLVEGGAAALASSNDPMIGFVTSMDEAARAAQKRHDDEVEAVQRRGYADIAAARFAADGDAVYPDATFTLRMAYGAVKGYEEDGKQIAPFTTFAGAFERAKERRGQEGFDLPASWEKAKSSLDLNTPFNFVCTADIIGGNSGSPVVNAKGEVVGLIFDGNIHSLVGDVIFDETRNRAVAVDSRALIAALRGVYHNDALANELTQDNAR